MPTLLIVRNLMFILHTRDHGHLHVTVYQGSPENYEALAKVRLDSLTIIEVSEFSKRDIALILEIVTRHQADWLEVWNEVFKNR